MGVPLYLAIKAEALHLEGRTFEALEAVREAETLAEKSNRTWCAELCRLRAVLLARLGGNEALIEDAFCEAIGRAKQQKSASLATRAEASYAAYRSKEFGAERPTDSADLLAFRFA